MQKLALIGVGVILAGAVVAQGARPGVVLRRERSMGRHEHFAPTTKPSIDQIFSRVDTDGNGVISESEFAAFIEHRREHATTQPSEHAATTRPSPAQIFKHADTDGNGVLSKAEFTAFVEAHRPTSRPAH